MTGIVHSQHMGQARGPGPCMKTPPLRWPVPALSCVLGVGLICTLFRRLLHFPYNVCLCRLIEEEMDLCSSSIQRCNWKQREVGNKLSGRVWLCERRKLYLDHSTTVSGPGRKKNNALNINFGFLPTTMSTLL